MENSTYYKFGIALLFIVIYGFASLLVYLDKRKMKNKKNIDIEEQISSSSSNHVNKKKFAAKHPKVNDRKNLRMKNEVASKN